MGLCLKCLKVGNVGLICTYLLFIEQEQMETKENPSPWPSSTFG